VALLFVLLSAWTAAAQTTSAVDGKTPAGLAPGSPAGSYTLSGFETVNLFNGGLNFRLPLLKAGGRGGAGYSVMLPVEQKWIVKAGQPNSSGVAPLTPNPNWWQGIRPGYGPGVMHGRRGNYEDGRVEESVGCDGMGQGCTTVLTEIDLRTLTRLTFTASDGAEYELRDQQTDGSPHADAWYPQTGDHAGFSRGAVFVTADGSSAAFISDSAVTDYVSPNMTQSQRLIYPSGYLLLADGARYRIDSGTVSWIRDRNGNKVTFTYGAGSRVASATDSLGRQVTFTYDDGVRHYDEIDFKGFGGAARTLRVWYDTLANRLRPNSGYSTQTYYHLFPLNSASTTTQYNPSSKVSAVELPDNRRYQLYYNPYGELARVVLPTGGAIEYDWAGGADPTDATIFRYVTKRRVYPSGGATWESQAEYVRSGDGALSSVEEKTTDASGALLARSLHYFHGDASESLVEDPSRPSVISYSKWREGREYRTEAYDIVGGTPVLKRVVEQTWQQPLAGAAWPLSGQGETDETAKPNDPQLTQTKTTLSDANQMSKQTFAYDLYGNRTDVYEYGFGAGAPGALVRRAHTDYVTTNVVGGVTYDYACDPATTCSNASINTGVVHLRGLPKQMSVYDAGVEQSRTTFEYDNYTAAANHAALVARSSISGLDAAFTTAYQTRGNATAATSYLLTNGAVTGSVSTYAQYDVAGDAVKAVDGRGNATTFGYADCFGAPDANARLNTAPAGLGGLQSYAYVTSATNALGQVAHTQYDYYTGGPVDGEDANGVVSSGYYNDALDRPTQVVRAASHAGVKSQSTFAYDDVNRVVTSTGDQTAYGDNRLKSQTLYDGLGRATEGRAYETATAYVTTKTVYDALGRVRQVSNPYRSGDAVVYTTTAYDTLGRVTSVTTPDGATAVTAYSGAKVTVTDQAGKDRESTTDALGRLTQVVEDPGGLAYVTTYAYDALDNLKTVTQGAQTRSFAYDSLRRLTSATNPESGAVSYLYDNNGNVTRRTDARSIQTDISYDALNRPTSKTYTDATPDLAYYYDAQALPTGAPSFSRGSSTGRLVAVTYGGSAGSYYGYDALGRALTRVQQTDSVNYVTDAAYNLAGATTSETYPLAPGQTVRRTVAYGFDQAGRLSSLSSAATGYSAAASVSSVAYAAHGALSSETYGNGLLHQVGYNARLQPSTIRLGTGAAPASVLSLTYNYGTTANNGNVLDVTNVVGAATTKQVYSYDQLNRLSSTQETNGSTTTYWTEADGYDRYGNRWEVVGGVPDKTFNTNNRIVGGSYDAAGNLLGDGTHAYGYDAEDRITTVDGAAGVYRYDGEGQRVRKEFASGDRLRLVYDVAGRLVSEFSSVDGAIKKEYVYGAEGLLATIEPGANGARYVTPDHLGTPRVATNSAGAVASRHDYAAFGGELFAGMGGRSTAMGYPGASDGLRQKFTAYERDAETGLDYAQARHYACAQGRFTSSDPLLINSERLLDPQLLNLYAYARNNPLKFTDPTGMDVTLEGAQQADYITSLNQRDDKKFTVANVGNKVRIVDDKGKQYDADGLKALGDSLSDGEKELFNAITDENNHAVIDTGNGQPDDSIDFGRNDAAEAGGPEGRNTLDMTEMKLLDSPSNKGGLPSGDAVAHETLEAYASAQHKRLCCRNCFEVRRGSAE
jgi:RHS repeat-associated protein